MFLYKKYIYICIYYIMVFASDCRRWYRLWSFWWMFNWLKSVKKQSLKMIHFAVLNNNFLAPTSRRASFGTIWFPGELVWEPFDVQDGWFQNPSVSRRADFWTIWCSWELVSKPSDVKESWFRNPAMSRRADFGTLRCPGELISEPSDVLES